MIVEPAAGALIHLCRHAPAGTGIESYVLIFGFGVLRPRLVTKKVIFRHLLSHRLLCLKNLLTLLLESLSLQVELLHQPFIEDLLSMVELLLLGDSIFHNLKRPPRLVNPAHHLVLEPFNCFSYLVSLAFLTDFVLEATNHNQVSVSLGV